MNFLTLRSAALSLALASSAAAALAADPNSFVLVKDGKNDGKATYSIDTAKDGYHIKSRYEYHLTVAPSATSTTSFSTINEAQFSNDYKVDLNGNYISGYTQNATNQMITSFQPNKTRDIVTVNQIQGGMSGGGKPLPLPRPDFLVAPDYDPSALQILLTTSLAHPHADSKYTFVVPGTGMGPKAANTIVYVSVQAQPDANGTLDGKPITLKHFQMNYAKGKADLFTDADGKLMQADMGTLATSYIRVKFVLAGQ